MQDVSRGDRTWSLLAAIEAYPVWFDTSLNPSLVIVYTHRNYRGLDMTLAGIFSSGGTVLKASIAMTIIRRMFLELQANSKVFSFCALMQVTCQDGHVGSVTSQICHRSAAT